MGLNFFIREATRSLRRNAVPSFAAMVAVLVTTLVLGVFIPAVQATTGAANDVRGKLLLDVYLKPAATAGDAQRVRVLLTQHTPHIKKVEFVSKTAALAQQRKQNAQAFELLGRNPLPDTFHVVPDNPSNIERIRDSLSPLSPNGHRIATDPAIDEVKNRRDETNKILSATSMVKLSMGLLAGLLILAATLLIANTIRLSLFARRREVEVMKLVGATDWFIRWPFVIEGVICGALGGVAAVALLTLAKVALIDPLAKNIALVAAPNTINFPLLIVLLLGASILVSAAGSGISLRRFLRV
ncbi:MAG TPA: permease-like cell division protein FtsX [Solirubrobacteraceae bacterium]|nr:permease-like cell division protein FtsX [Solirubrobacteraceae bacterium]